MIQEILTEIDQLGSRFSQEIAVLKNQNDILKLKSNYIGKKGLLAGILGGLKDLPNADRPTVGQKANTLKGKIEEECRELLSGIKAGKIAEQTQEEKVDVTLPGRALPVGSSHPLSQVQNEIEEIFIRMGFEVNVGEDIETDYYNFESLNFLEDHPARDMQDTFYIDDAGATPRGRPNKGRHGDLPLLRTHTSPVQIHVMENQEPPIQMIAPGTVYRRDTLDVSHSPVFNQVEGLLVDKGVRFSDLKGTLENFVHRFFGPKIPMRLRPSFFPFTEPSAEVDIGCLFCTSKGCNVCKKTGWLEVLGCGMVAPNVLRNVKYNPEKVSGFAFGMGIERMAMLKYGINDIRLFYENDVNFLKQF